MLANMMSSDADLGLDRKFDSNLPVPHNMPHYIGNVYLQVQPGDTYILPPASYESLYVSGSDQPWTIDHTKAEIIDVFDHASGYIKVAGSGLPNQAPVTVQMKESTGTIYIGSPNVKAHFVRSNFNSGILVKIPALQ